MAWKTGPRGIELIKEYEELRLKAYKPTPNDVWTIGYGHTRGVKEGDVITWQRAEELLREDLADAERAVNRLGLDLSQAQFDALVSLVFNVGAGCLGEGTTIGTALRKRDWFAAGAGFILWRKQARRDMRGLARRRAREMELYFSDRLPA